MDIKQELNSYLHDQHTDSYSDCVHISLVPSDNYQNFLFMSKKNHEIRKAMLEEFQKFETLEERIDAIKKFFGKNFLYDYHLVFNPSKKIIYRKFDLDGIKFSCAASVSADDDILSDNIYLTKLAQCSTYAAEVKYLMEQMGYDCKLVKTEEDCFNAFNGKMEKIGHCYNEVDVDGKKYTIDVCKDIMNRDKLILEEQNKVIKESQE